jgi:mannose-6-phosphate isomerase-like protein (cupin superfamily)
MSDSDNQRDQHQKIHRFREGDIIEIPAGAEQWEYNDGETPLIVILPEEESEPQEKE